MLQKVFIITLLCACVLVGIFCLVWLRSEKVNINSLVWETKFKTTIFAGLAKTLSFFVVDKPQTTILFLGDIMLDRGVEAQMKKNGYDYPWQKIVLFLQGFDVVVANLEGPIVKNPPKLAGDPMQFAFSQEAGKAMAMAGINLVSLANNHTLNMGQNGLLETKDFLTQQSVIFLGDPIDCEKDSIFIKDNLVFLAFNQTFYFNCPSEKIISIVAKANNDYPNNVLIVILHWGQEYEPVADKMQIDLAHSLVEAGADAVFGGHPHVSQNIEEYQPFGAAPASAEASAGRQGRPIFYSLGNFIFDQYFSQETQQSLAVAMEIYKNKVVYKLSPVGSNLSQPFVMQNQEKQEFLDSLASRSSENIQKQIQQAFFIVK